MVFGQLCMSYGQKEMVRTTQQILGDFQHKTEQHSRVIFFTEIQKSNDSEYKQDSLCTMLPALGRHLWQVGAQYSIINVALEECIENAEQDSSMFLLHQRDDVSLLTRIPMKTVYSIISCICIFTSFVLI